MNPLVLKVGGVLLDNPQAMQALLQEIAHYRQQHQRQVVIVHGGGCIVDQLLKQLNLPVQKKAGLRITPADQIDIITGALAGIANKKLLAQALTLQLPAVGLCLADAWQTVAKQFDADLGHVANVTPHDPNLLENLLAQGYLPLVSSIGIDEQGELMNVNGDQAAITIAELIGAELVLLSDVDGVLDANKQRCTQLNEQQIQQMINDGVITEGMIVKVNAALEAARKIGRGVEIANWKHPERLADILKGEIVGTRILP